MQRQAFKAGDFVVYRKSKHSLRPGPRAQDVFPARSGESYSYYVDKFWIVTEVREDGKVLLATRRGKTHLVDPDDPNLRRAGLWDRLLYGPRFAELTAQLDAQKRVAS